MRLSEKITGCVKYIRFWLFAHNSYGHGVHSPFVFAFIKKIMNAKTGKGNEDVMKILLKGYDKKMHLLLYKAIRYYQPNWMMIAGTDDLPVTVMVGDRSITLLPFQGVGTHFPASAGCLLIPAEIAGQLESCLHQLHPDSWIVVTGIHRLSKYERQWKRLAGSATVTLAIDLYKMGFIFLKKEMKVKQYCTIRF